MGEKAVVDVEMAQAHARAAVELEVYGYEQRLRDRTAQFVFKDGRQADLFAAVNAAAKAERDLDREIESELRLNRLAETLQGCLADRRTALRIAVQTRRGEEKNVVFGSARRAARFAIAVQDAGLEWRVEREPRERTLERDPARLAFERSLSRASGVSALRFLLHRGMKYDRVLEMSLKADRDLKELVAAEKARKWRAMERRWREVRDAQRKVDDALGKGDALERVLGRIGVRPETYLVDESLQMVARRAALQVQSERDRKLVEAYELRDLHYTGSQVEDRPPFRRVVVVDTPADVLAHRQTHGVDERTGYISVGFGPLEDANAIRGDGLAISGRKFEQTLLDERWRAWEAGEKGPLTVVFALGTSQWSKDRAAVLKRLVPKERMFIERQAPMHAATWWEELRKRERDYVREQEALSPRRAGGRGLGMSP